MIQRFCLFFLLFACASSAIAQDSNAVAPTVNNAAFFPPTLKEKQIDSPKTKVKFQPDAKTAALFSALIPGMGQIYNRQYWKAPIVYAVMGTPIFFAIKRQQEYQRYRKAYIARITDPANSKDEFQGILSLPAIKQYQDEAKQSMDMMLVYTVIGYAGQILEAISGAHLRNFDISKDLTMQIRPTISPYSNVGLGLVICFKK